MYVDMGQEMAQRLKSPAEPPLRDTLPHRILDSINTSNGLPNKRAMNLPSTVQGNIPIPLRCQRIVCYC